MSTALNSERSAILRQNRASRSERLLRAVRTPGGAVFILLIGLLAAIIVLNPSFGEPSSFIRFVGRTAPIAIAAIGQYFVIVGGEFDLSMGSVVTMQVIVAGNLIGQDDSKVIP
ncbi:MAG: ABC transporter permease, partial [Arthrobacter sp.]